MSDTPGTSQVLAAVPTRSASGRGAVAGVFVRARAADIAIELCDRHRALAFVNIASPAALEAIADALNAGAKYLRERGAK